MVKTDRLKTPSRLLRGPIMRGETLTRGAVDPEGGQYGAGLIRGLSVIQRGPALGHGFWVDATMLKQVGDEINTTADGVKSHFAHISMSGDGIGQGLGRLQNARVAGDKTFADLHIWESADREDARKLLTRAEEDPASFGLSIAFAPDIEAEKAFVEDAGGKYMIDDWGDIFVKDFESPDPLNTENLPHARVAELRSADAVGDPAANADGLFDSRGNELLDNADALLSYAFGLTGRRSLPHLLALSEVAPDRIRGFAQRWLDAHGLRIVPALRVQRAVVCAVEADGA
jgi:hypothetical protein